MQCLSADIQRIPSGNRALSHAHRPTNTILFLENTPIYCRDPTKVVTAERNWLARIKRGKIKPAALQVSMVSVLGLPAREPVDSDWEGIKVQCFEGASVAHVLNVTDDASA